MARRYFKVSKISWACSAYCGYTETPAARRNFSIIAENYSRHRIAITVRGANSDRQTLWIGSPRAAVFANTAEYVCRKVSSVWFPARRGKGRRSGALKAVHRVHFFVPGSARPFWLSEARLSDIDSGWAYKRQISFSFLQVRPTDHLESRVNC